MITNPILPIWLMSIVYGVCGLFLIINTARNVRIIKENKHSSKRYIVYNFISKLVVIALLFCINLRIKTPNGDAMQVSYDVNVLFIIDNTVSMRALDYDGEKERIDGVIKDCCHIVDKIPGAKYSVVTFTDTAEQLMPFTTDADMVKSELKCMRTEDDLYATGTSINSVNSTVQKIMDAENKRQEGVAKFVVFFVTDGEITITGEDLESFSNLNNNICGGAVMGYGTTEGGKMVSLLYKDEKGSDYYYVYTYDKNYNKQPALSKIDENNLNSIADDMGIPYVHMVNQKKIDPVIDDVSKKIVELDSMENKINTYADTYYYFAIPLAAILIIDFIIKKRKIY